MRRTLPLVAALLLFPLAATAPARPRPPTPRAAHDWAQTVTLLPDGAYLRGNPAAKVKLVEYFSMTCPHCAAFSAESAAPLSAYFKAGTVSLEMRHAVRDSLDLAASLLARCAGPQRYVGTIAAIFAQQQDWGTRADTFIGANSDRLNAMPRDAALAEVAKGSGLDVIAGAHGVPAARVPACVASVPEQKALAQMTSEAWGTRKIPGTPSFLLNGKLLDKTASWDQLAPQLAAALR